MNALLLPSAPVGPGAPKPPEYCVRDLSRKFARAPAQNLLAPLLWLDEIARRYRICLLVAGPAKSVAEGTLSYYDIFSERRRISNRRKAFRVIPAVTKVDSSLQASSLEKMDHKIEDFSESVSSFDF